MRKHIILILIIILCIIFLTACGLVKDDIHIKENALSVEKSDKDIENSNSDIMMFIFDETLTPNGTKLSMHNESKQDVSFGRQYFIQILIEDEWYDIIIPPVDWTLELITLEPGQEQTFVLNWSFIYGELPAGTYRIIKEYKMDSSTLFAFCEFEIS